MSGDAPPASRDDRLFAACLGLHPDRLRALLERHGSPSRLLAEVKRGRVDGVDRQLMLAAERCRLSIDATGCRVVMRGDRGYPAILAGIEDPPDVLFVRGSMSGSPGVAVVGTRRCTTYGTRIAHAYGKAIAAAGWPLVSGLARGIDAAAHTGTVTGGGHGIAVLGSGPDVVYPRENLRLHDSLLGLGGAVITEYPPGTAPNGWRFPPRNRIIAGLSAAVVVVEAPLTGGALVTAAKAVAQGRTVFAVPGDIDRAASEGCNRLIRDGAVPVFDPADLVEALSFVLGPPPAEPAAAPPVAPDEPEAPDLIGPAGATIDELGVRLGIRGPALLSLLGRLELEGRIRRQGELILPGR